MKDGGGREGTSVMCVSVRSYIMFITEHHIQSKTDKQGPACAHFETQDMRRRATLLTGNHHTSQHSRHANTHTSQSVAVTYGLPNPLLHRGHHSNRRERGESSAVETHQSQQHIIEIPAPQSAERGDASKCVRPLAESVEDRGEKDNVSVCE